MEDNLPKEYSPWRRFFARNLDFAVYSILWKVILIKVLNYNILRDSIGMDFLGEIVALLMMYAFEPILLSVFGTTVGKWVCGIRITDNNGGKLTYSVARARTASVLCHGIAFNIPFLSLYVQYKRYKECTSGNTLEWEYDSNIHVKDREIKIWRIISYLGVYAVLFVFYFVAYFTEWLPQNRGEITVAEFCENYNGFAEFIGYSDNEYLDEDGEWIKKNAGSSTIYVGSTQVKPDFVFEETDGIMTGLSFEVISESGEIWGGSCNEEMQIAIRSFVGADKRYGPFDKKLNEVLDWVEEHEFESFDFDVYDAEIRCEVEYLGSGEPSLGIVWSDGEMKTVKTGKYVIRFSMSK